jgi:branched-chain amino acid aminotransferase
MPGNTYVLMNGRPVPQEEAVIPVSAPAVAYASAVFEGIRAYWSERDRQMYVFRLDDHLRRLQFSMRAMRYDAEYDLATLRTQTLEAIRVNELRQDIHLRMTALVTGATAITTSGPVTLAITAGPYPPNQWVDRGMAVGVSSWQRVHDTSSPPRIKATANYSNGRLAMLEARQNGYDAALMLTREGKVAEAPVATCFVVRNGDVLTPACTDGILESITRSTLIELFRDEFRTVVTERSVDRTELYDAEEMFLCGSGWEVTPVASVDRIPMRAAAPGPVTRRIRDTYMHAVRGELPARKAWLTPVW